MSELAIANADASIEKKLEQSGEMAIKTAEQLVIDSQESYEEGAKYLRVIKERIKQIGDYWAEPKKAAHQAHQNIVAREKAMLEPMQKSDKIINEKMRAYMRDQEEKRRKAEAEARRKAEEEARRLLDEAIKAEEKGDAQAAATNMAMATMVSETPIAPVVETPKAQGINTRKVWKAEVTDPAIVPAYFNGMEIRNINMSTLNKIASMTKGSASIPGVRFFEDTILAVRR